MGDGFLKTVSWREWSASEALWCEPRLVELEFDRPRLRERPLLILIPGFMADFPRSAKPDGSRFRVQSSTAELSAWGRKAYELGGRIGCDVTIFAWPSGVVDHHAEEAVRERSWSEAAPWFAKQAAMRLMGWLAYPLVATVEDFREAFVSRMLTADKVEAMLARSLWHVGAYRSEIYVLGHSLGGRVALRTAVTHTKMRADERRTLPVRFGALAPAVGPHAFAHEPTFRHLQGAEIGWSRFDHVLRFAFSAATLNQEGAALGLGPPADFAPSIHAHDLSYLPSSKGKTATAHETYTEHPYEYLCSLPLGGQFIENTRVWSRQQGPWADFKV